MRRLLCISLFKHTRHFQHRALIRRCRRSCLALPPHYSAAHFFIKKPVKPASVATTSRMNLFLQEPFVGYEYYLPSLFLREAIDGKSHSIPIIVVSKKKTAVRDDLPIIA